VLLVGAGGGFDLYAGLPLFFALRRAGKTVHLANLSFADLSRASAIAEAPAVHRVVAEAHGSEGYFPELPLAYWLKKYAVEQPVYALDRTGVRGLTQAYDWLAREFAIDALILVDGGTDGLMRGDEASLGTPEEDFASLAAAQSVSGVDKKRLISIGFGVDSFHGVSHALVLENISALIRDGGFLGAWSLRPDDEDFLRYRDAYAYSQSGSAAQASIVNASILSAVEGRFGEHHATRRTEGSKLFINPLMGLYWSFDLDHVARRTLCLEAIRGTTTSREISAALERFRESLALTRPRQILPI
jgi:hypothetical protein